MCITAVDGVEHRFQCGCLTRGESTLLSITAVIRTQATHAILWICPVRSRELIVRLFLGLQYTAEPLLGAGLAFALLGERCASNAHGHLISIVTLHQAASRLVCLLSI